MMTIDADTVMPERRVILHPSLAKRFGGSWCAFLGPSEGSRHERLEHLLYDRSLSYDLYLAVERRREWKLFALRARRFPVRLLSTGGAHS